MAIYINAETGVLDLTQIPENELNAMQIALMSEPKTIGELKAMLAAMEAAWTKQDEMYLGKFNDQGLYVSTPQGVDHATIVYDGGFGFVTVPTSL